MVALNLFDRRAVRGGIIALTAHSKIKWKCVVCLYFNRFLALAVVECFLINSLVTS